MAIDLKAGIDHAAFVRDVEKGMKLANRAMQKRANSIKLKLDDKGFRQPLGRITGDLNMFDSALAASNARVIAFGASTAVIGGISKAFKELAKTTIEVGKQFADINRILSLSNKNFEKFGNQLFEISKKNATAFQDTTKAALEFARQGLKTEETLKRTSDALTLVRLTGINADKAVATLTATVNAFEGTMLDTTTAVNKFVAVETKFAVGARDLVEAIGRVGSSARDAKVGFDELNAMVTSVQQTTGRGGAVIGNAMKTIFTRLQRQSTLEALESYNVAVRDVEGNTLPAMRILDNFAKSYAGLADASQSYLREQVAGVFQANILSAILKDLNKQQSTYSSALHTSTNATDEANQATAELNRTLSALVEQTGLEFQRLQSNIGKATFEPIARELLAPLKGLMKGINDLIDGEGAGSEVANGLLKGIRNVLGGPGLVAAFGLIAKVFFNTTAYIFKSLPALAGITTETQKRANLEKQVESILQRESGLALAIQGYTGNTAMQAKLLADYAQMAADDMDRQEASVAGIAATLMKMPKGALNVAAVTSGGKGGRRGASGFIPGMAGEIHDIKKGVGGVSPSARPVVIPNFAFGGGVRGTMIANTGEHIVPNFKGGGSAIFNPNMIAQYGMPAGAKPIRGAGGYVPNFVDVNKANAGQMAREAGITRESHPSLFTKGGDIRVAALRANLQRKSGAKTSKGRFFDARQKAHMLTPQAGFKVENYPYIFGAGSALQKMSSMVSKDGKPVDGMLLNAYGPSLTASKDAQKGGRLAKVEDVLDNALVKAAESVIMAYSPSLATIPVSRKKVEGTFLKEGGAGAMGAFKGALFEAIVSRLVGQKFEKGAANTSTLDILLSGTAGRNAEQLFGITGSATNATHADVKSSWSSGNRTKITEQIMKNFGKSLPITMGAAARGYVPNFAALGDAVEREAAAGVPLGSIRVGRSSRLAGPNNPAGLGVTNTRDEPRGLADVVGASRGYVPNYVDPMGVDVGGVVGKTNKQLAGLNNGFARFQRIIDKVALQLAKKEITEAQAMRATQRLGAAAGKSGAALTTLQTRVKTTASTMASTASASKGEGFMGGARGMGMMMGLSMGLPMLAGGAEQAGAGRETTGALTAAGTGASIGMIAGPKGALVGAIAGAVLGFVFQVNKVGLSLETLSKDLQEFERTSTEQTTAAEEYIKAQQDLTTATTSAELEDAQKRIAKNFEAIKGTALEEHFREAGTDVDKMTDSLKTFAEGVKTEGALRRAMIRGTAAGTDLKGTVTTKPFQTGFKAVKPGGGQTQLVPTFEDRVVTDTKKRAELLRGIFEDLFDTAFPKGAEGMMAAGRIQSIAKNVKDSFLGMGNKPFTSEFDMARKDILEIFQDIAPVSMAKLSDEEKESLLPDEVIRAMATSFVDAFNLEHIEDLVAAAQLKRIEQLQDSFSTINKRLDESINSIKDSTLMKFKDSFKKLNTTLSSIGSDIRTVLGDEVGAARFRADATNRQSFLANRATRQQFGISQQDIFAKKFKGSFALGSDQLGAFENVSNLLLTNPGAAMEELRNLTRQGDMNREPGLFAQRRGELPKAAEFRNAAKEMIRAFEIQEQNIATEELINKTKQSIEQIKAKNLMDERALQASEKLALTRRENVTKLEQMRMQQEIDVFKLRADDPARARGLTTTQNQQRQFDNQRAILEKQIAMDEARVKAENKNLEMELESQKTLINSNLALVGAEEELKEATLKLATLMASQLFGTEYDKGLGAAANLTPLTRQGYIDQELERAGLSPVSTPAGSTGSNIPESGTLPAVRIEKSSERVATIQEQINRLEKQYNADVKGNNEQLRERIKNLREQLDLEEEIGMREAKRDTEFKAGLQEGFDTIYKDIDHVYNRLGKDLPTAFRDGMVNALEASLDKAESFGDAMRGVAVDMLKMIRRASLTYSMNNLTSLIGMGASEGFRESGKRPGSILHSQNGAFVPGTGSGDRIPAMLEPGEYVMNRKAVQGVGKNNLDAVNFGAFPRFGNGGMMGINESATSNRMSGFFLASDNPELMEAREAARAAYEKKQAKKAEKKQLLSTFLQTVATVGVGKLIDMGADKFKDFKTKRDLKRTGESTGFYNSPEEGGFDFDYQRGGRVKTGFSNRDSVPAYMAGGEFVMNNRAVRKYGLGFMGRLNGGLIPAMQTGGVVGPEAAPLNTQTAANTNNISINVSVGGGGGGGQGASESTGNVNASEQSNTDQATQGKELSERIRSAVVEVIQQEQRLGGSLSKNSRQA